MSARRRPRLGEVADEHALGELHAAHAVLERELRRVLVLALARMHVEVDAAELRARAHHVERRARSGASAGVGRPATYVMSKISRVISSSPASTRSYGKYWRTSLASTS